MLVPENGIKDPKFQRKRRKRKFNKAFILLIVLVYIVSRTTPILTEGPGKIHTVTHGTLEDRLSFEGIILRKEAVIARSSRGSLVESGQRVAKGQSVTESLHSPASGVISTTVDGFEEVLDFEEILKAPKTCLDTVQQLIDQESIDKKGGIRLIRGYQWGALGKVTPKEGKALSPGQNIWIESGEQRVRGTVAWIGEGEEDQGFWVMVESTEDLQGVYDNRRQNITLVKQTVEGLTVPLDAVYYQGDHAYVTRKKDGKNTEVPVKVLLADEERAILSKDSFIDEKGEAQPTVSLYDEVLLNQQNSRGEDRLDE